MKRIVSSFLPALVAILGVAGPAAPVSAMTSLATPDGDNHPAAVVLLRSDGDSARPFCSGMLVSGSVVLTASHCLAGVPQWGTDWELIVSNDAVLALELDGWVKVASLKVANHVSQIVLNPAYNPKRGYAHDVSAAVLAAPVALASEHFPTLPPRGLLSQLKSAGALRSATLSVLGYGLTEMILPSPGGQWYYRTGERRIAQLGIDALDPRFIHEGQRIAQGTGGACYGDSGGPSLLQVDAVTYVVGVTSSGDIPCFATNTATRTDTDEAIRLLQYARNIAGEQPQQP